MNLKIGISFLIALIVFSSCRLSKSVYTDHMDEGINTDYVNDSLGFVVEYSGNYNLFTEPSEFKQVKKYRVLNTIATAKNPLAEILVVGESDVSHNYKTALIAYPKKDLSQFSESIIAELNKNNSLDTLTFFHHSKEEKLLADNYSDFSTLQSYEFNRLVYEIEIRNKHWLFMEYHLSRKDYNFRFIWWIDKENGFDKDMEALYKLPSLKVQADHIVNSMQDSPHASDIDPFSLAANAFMKNGNYLSPVYSLFQSKEFYSKDWSQRNQYWQAKMTYESFAGNYKEALISADQTFGIKKDTASQDLFLNFQPKDAREIIKDRSRDAQIVMLNEAHHVPYHRAFLRDILPMLYENGYRYLAVETLFYEDSLINDRKFPVQSSGFYSREPVFGQLLRRALELGFILLPYEDMQECEWTAGSDQNYCNSQRDLNQAKNISQFLSSHPDAKIVVYSGYDHVQEKNNDTWKHMAQYLNELTGINPLTIDQTEMNEKSSSKYENPYYQMAHLQFNIVKPSVFMKGDTCWIKPNREKFYDLQIVHPRSEYMDGIPSWQFPRSALTKATKIKYKGGKNTMQLLEMYLEEEMEEEDPVPVLNALLLKKKNVIRLNLPKGKYVWLVKNIDKSTNDLHHLNIK